MPAPEGKPEGVVGDVGVVGPVDVVGDEGVGGFGLTQPGGLWTRIQRGCRKAARATYT